MDIAPVPDSAKAHYPNHVLVDIGPPPGVPDDYCGTAQMLLGRMPSMPGFAGRDQLAYFKPSQSDLELLNAGGYIVMNQIGSVVQPFSVGAWPAEHKHHECRKCGATWSGPGNLPVACPVCPPATSAGPVDPPAPPHQPVA